MGLHFNPAQGLPGSHAHLQVTASPKSLCGLRAVDQSVLLLKPEAELSPTTVSSVSPRHQEGPRRGLRARRNLSGIGLVKIIFI